jgi:hypothetical protein
MDNKKESHDHSQPPLKDKESTADIANGIDVAPNKDSASRQLDNDNRKEKLSRFERIAVIMGLIIAALNVGILIYQSYVIHGQLKEMQGTSQQTDEIIAAERRIADAAQTNVTQGKEALDQSLAASQNSLNANIEASRLEQRAWVGPTEITNSEITIGTKPVFTVIIQNTGKTPAFKFHTILVRKPRLKEHKFTPTYDMAVEGPNTLGNILPGMRAIIKIPWSTEITADSLEHLKTGKVIINVNGKINYLDAFGRPHYSTFCTELDKNLTSMKGCETYNDAN